ncbi:TPA: hypothetical protein ACGEYH_002964 [Providencia rettgeri]|uniref:hypothetical protein n=1 Tax=Providencia TaxID=586 RepID=UPI00234B2DF3|nr:hypothetical protein [Providencia sp. PROV259]
MKYKIRHKNKVIGITALEGGDPPMGFVFGMLEPTVFYTADIDKVHLSLYTDETNEEIACNSISFDDYSAELGEQCIEVTVLVESAEEYAKFFKHHLDAYEKQFG